MNSARNSSDPRSWIGRSEETSDEIRAFPLNGLAATLDREDPPAVAGTPVPPLWHWLYFLPVYRPSDMRRDGHSRGSDFLPPVALPRRMWAGSKFEWNTANPLRVADTAVRVSRIESITEKEGRTGKLVFLKVVHEVSNRRGLALTNEHQTAFRGFSLPGQPESRPVVAETASAWHRVVAPDPVLLFRYSALTFNAHRIHYDSPYATQEEGYPGILVQGPLVATLLLDLVRRNVADARIRSLELKAVRPAFVDRPLHLRGMPEGDTIRLWTADDKGFVTMMATAEIES